MDIFNMLDADTVELIVGFAGIAEQWKLRFTSDVLPKIEQGWMEVGNGSSNPDEYIPCANCYMYANSVCGNGRFCMNCFGTEKSSIVSFQQMKELGRVTRYFETFETFKMYRESYNRSIERVTDEVLQASPIFKEMNKLNIN